MIYSYAHAYCAQQIRPFFLRKGTYVHVCACVLFVGGCVELESARGVNHVNRKHVVCALMRILKQTLGTADHVCGRDGF